MNANVSDRNSLMTIYPLECFVIDAAQNSMARETTRHGLLIETAPDHDGPRPSHISRGGRCKQRRRDQRRRPAWREPRQLLRVRNNLPRVVNTELSIALAAGKVSAV